jgi:hypothetical protein
VLPCGAHLDAGLGSQAASGWPAGRPTGRYLLARRFFRARPGRRCVSVSLWRAERHALEARSAPESPKCQLTGVNCVRHPGRCASVCLCVTDSCARSAGRPTCRSVIDEIPTGRGGRRRIVLSSPQERPTARARYQNQSAQNCQLKSAIQLALGASGPPARAPSPNCTENTSSSSSKRTMELARESACQAHFG